MLLIGNDFLTDVDPTEDDDFADRRRVCRDVLAVSGVTCFLFFELLLTRPWKFVFIDRGATDVHDCIIDEESFGFSCSSDEPLILSRFFATLSDSFTKPVSSATFLFCFLLVRCRSCGRDGVRAADAAPCSE